jgi:hypothetical protein
MRGHEGTVLKCAPESCHLSKNIRQTTDCAPFEANPQNRGMRGWNHDVGGEYAVYMMAWARKTPAKTGFSGDFGRAYSAKVGTGFAIRIRAKPLIESIFRLLPETAIIPKP